MDAALNLRHITEDEANVPSEDSRRPRYLNRHLSWLEFDARVLALAEDPSLPLLERVKFLAIFNQNLDEFFQVRVAEVDEQVELGIKALSPDGQTNLGTACRRTGSPGCFQTLPKKRQRSPSFEVSTAQHSSPYTSALRWPWLVMCGAHFGDPRDLGDRPANRFVPALGHQVSPPAAHSPEVSPQLALVVEERGIPVFGQLEPFDDVRNGAAQEPEVDGAGTLEPDGLDGGRHQPVPDRRPVGRQHHLLRALQNLDLFGERRRRRCEIGRGDHVEDEFTGRLDACVDGPERSDRAPDRQIYDEFAGHQSPVGPMARDHGERADRARRPHRPHVPDSQAPLAHPRSLERTPDGNYSLLAYQSGRTEDLRHTAFLPGPLRDLS